MDQFKLTKVLELNLFGVDISITNSTLMLFVILAVLMLLLTFLTKKVSIIPSKKQSFAEGFYNFIAGMVTDNIKYKNSIKFFPLVFSLFMFILFSNALGVIPYTFTITSHISITFTIALIVFFTMVTVAIKKKGLKGYLSGFAPSGIPVFIVPLIFIIEFFTYLIRPVTLAIRLAANMIAGHTMLKVMAGFVAGMGVFGVIPVLFIAVLTGFEFFVACLQAYIFSMLTCIYLNEATSLEH